MATTSSEGTAFRAWSWFISIALWASLLFLLASALSSNKTFIIPALITSGIFYVAYLISALLAPTFRYFLNPTTGADIYGYMQKIFYSPINLSMFVQCWHNQTTFHEEKDSQGRTHTVTKTVRVNTHSASENFHYKSWRDVSGRFILDTSGAMRSQQRAFIRVHLGLRLELANDGTKVDFEQQKASFINRNRLDQYQDYHERVTMENFNKYNFVKVSDYEPEYFGAWWYVLFAVLGGAEFYKKYVEKFCIEQAFEVVKVVSTRRDLNAVAEYNPMVPGIVYMGETRVFDAPMGTPLLEQNMNPSFQNQQ
eukprot:TRINITY_DN136732_c0_g1_i1.p1 TRINITY_DN136732_c0_g1~~TRINITY_DN136732_c0_g1_i1.p1  ORF type:complete len:346 (+),score=5.80 TRINITY_DN136732_c0_g1_i1:113-1039(+)